MPFYRWYCTVLTSENSIQQCGPLIQCPHRKPTRGLISNLPCDKKGYIQYVLFRPYQTPLSGVPFSTTHTHTHGVLSGSHISRLFPPVQHLRDYPFHCHQPTNDLSLPPSLCGVFAVPLGLFPPVSTQQVPLSLTRTTHIGSRHFDSPTSSATSRISCHIYQQIQYSPGLLWSRTERPLAATALFSPFPVLHSSGLSSTSWLQISRKHLRHPGLKLERDPEETAIDSRTALSFLLRYCVATIECKHHAGHIHSARVANSVYV